MSKGKRKKQKEAQLQKQGRQFFLWTVIITIVVVTLIYLTQYH